MSPDIIFSILRMLLRTLRMAISIFILFAAPRASLVGNFCSLPLLTLLPLCEQTCPSM